MKKKGLIILLILAILLTGAVLLFTRNNDKKEDAQEIIEETITESSIAPEDNTESEDEIVFDEVIVSDNPQEDPYAYMDEEFPTATLVNEKALCDATGMEEYAALCLPYYLDEHIVDTDVIELRQLTIEYIEGSFVETDLAYIMRIKLKEEPNYYYDCCFSKEGRYWVFALEFIEHLPEDLDNYGSTLPFEFEYDESLLEDMDRTNVGAEVISEEQFLSGDY